MNTQLLPCTEEGIALAADLLAQGEVIAFPTETVYGLGANALNEAAVRQIFAVKGRPADNPLIVHVATPKAAEALCEISEAARRVMDAFCPGPITLLMPKKACVPAVVNAGLSSVAIRIPSHPDARRMLEACKLPIAAPSANTSGKPSPTTAQHVWHDLQGRIPLILDGGACEVGLESTVLDMTGDIPTVVRPGYVTPDMLLRVLPEVRVADSVLRPLKSGEKAVSPGMMYRHYAPGGYLTLVKGGDAHVSALCRQLYRQAEVAQKRVRILAFEENLDRYEGLSVLSIGSRNDPATTAHRLFGTLRRLDDEQIDVIFSEVLPPDGVGLAVMNRLSRAAAFRVLDADDESTFSLQLSWPENSTSPKTDDLLETRS